MINLFLTVGIPGCGKSTKVKQLIKEKGGIRISRDEIRFSLLNDGDDYFSKEKEVMKIFISSIQNAIKSKIENIYIDATHLTDKARTKLLNELELNDEVKLHCLVFDVDINLCIERNAQRIGREYVPVSVIRRMAYQVKAPSLFDHYAYDTITYFNENGEEVYKEVRYSDEEVGAIIKNIL